MNGLASFAEVAVPVAVHGTFTYTIPDKLRDAVRLGSRVEVEIGSKLTTGFVVGFNDTTDKPKLKPVRSVLDEELAKVKRFAGDKFDAARDLFDEITTDDEFVEFLTLPGYERLD